MAQKDTSPSADIECLARLTLNELPTNRKRVRRLRPYSPLFCNRSAVSLYLNRRNIVKAPVRRLFDLPAGSRQIREASTEECFHMRSHSQLMLFKEHVCADTEHASAAGEIFRYDTPGGNDFNVLAFDGDNLPHSGKSVMIHGCRVSAPDGGHPRIWSARHACEDRMSLIRCEPPDVGIILRPALFVPFA